MCLYSTFWEKWEKKSLAPYATASDDVWYAQRSEDDTKEKTFDNHGSRSRYRTSFEIDKDRIAKSQAFRRMEYKTQVFVTHEGDNYRTRLTHSLEVSEVARHIARSLRLNEHLVEAIALGHDLGHPPYGHTGENAINRWIENQNDYYKSRYFFCHNQQSVEILEHLEPGYDWDNRPDNTHAKGLNLTRAVKEGVLVHTSCSFRGKLHRNRIFASEERDTSILNTSDRNRTKNLYYPGSLEAQVVRLSDDIAQRISDLEDGLRSGILKKEHLSEMITDFFSDVKKEIFGKDDSSNINSNDEIAHPGKNYKSKIPRLLLYEIVSLLNHDNRGQGDDFKKIDYVNETIKDSEIVGNIGELMQDAAIMAFILHMWRDATILGTYSSSDQQSHRIRILKYLEIYEKIKEGKLSEISAFNLIGFLRGILLANATEHSFWNIHSRLNPTFSQFLNLEFKEYFKNTNEENKNKEFHVVFVVVDGLLLENGQGGLRKYLPAPPEEKLYHFRFCKEDEMKSFIETNINKILNSNGSALLNLKEDRNFTFNFLDQVDWQNKSEKTEETEGLFIKEHGAKPFWIQLEKIQIYFTGYQELCPGPKVSSQKCDYSIDHGISCNECPFFSNGRYPDINRLVRLHNYGELLDQKLKDLVTKRLHNSPRVARMNYMGEKIVTALLDEYLKKPRMMHQRVWHNLRQYSEARKITSNLKKWIDEPIKSKELKLFDLETYDEIVNEKIDGRNGRRLKNSRYSLIRRIISHVAGMTDRYLKNEYNRLTQGGREVEIPDEMYFFM